MAEAIRLDTANECVIRDNDFTGDFTVKPAEGTTLEKHDAYTRKLTVEIVTGKTVTKGYTLITRSGTNAR